MTERAASSTAVFVCQGRAVADGRYAVGRFSDPVARALLDPAEAEVVDRVRAGAGPGGGVGRLAYELVLRVGVGMVPRTVAIDDAVRSHPANQLVVLGAGLDSRAWRMPELAQTTVFEVDHPASQRDKLRRVGQRPVLARRLVPVSVDLARDPLGPALETAGFDPQRPSTWVWEGVVAYLTPGQVRSTVSHVSALSAPGSRLVVNYQSAWVLARIGRAVMRVVLRVARQPDPLAAEPWRSLWRPEQLRSVLEAAGFVVETDEDMLSLSTGMDLPPGSAASLVNSRVAVATRR